MMITDGIWKKGSPDRISPVQSIERYFQTSARVARLFAYELVQSLKMPISGFVEAVFNIYKKSPNAHALVHLFKKSCSLEVRVR